MSQTPVSSPKSSSLDEILQAASHLSHAETLELIAYLAQQIAQQAQQMTVSQTPYYWSDIAAIAPDLLGGQDAQEWVTQVRREWDRGQSE